MKKKILNTSILFLIIYLFISAIYVLFHINFGTEPEVVGMGFSESSNFLRIFMGLPKTYTTYQGVQPIYLIQVIIKIILCIFLIKYLFKNKK